MFCSKCGNKANEGAAFCQTCGIQLSNGTTEPQIQAVEPKKKGKGIIFAACLVVAIIIAVGALFFFLGGNSASDTGLTCAANRGSCGNPVRSPYDRCSEHLYLCKVCGKQIGSLDYGYCRTCPRR